MLDRDVIITGPQIEAARRLLRWTVSDLARRAGMGIADVQDIENATKLPKRRAHGCGAHPSDPRKGGHGVY